MATLSDVKKAELNELYKTLKPEAEAVARNYVLARTPQDLMLAMGDLIGADFPEPPPPKPVVVPTPPGQAPAPAPTPAPAPASIPSGRAPVPSS